MACRLRRSLSILAWISSDGISSIVSDFPTSSFLLLGMHQIPRCLSVPAGNVALWNCFSYLRETTDWTIQKANGRDQRSDPFDYESPQPDHLERHGNHCPARHIRALIPTNEISLWTDIHRVPIVRILRRPHGETFMVLFTQKPEHVVHECERHTDKLC